MSEDTFNTLLAFSWPLVTGFLAWLKGDRVWAWPALAGASFGILLIAGHAVGVLNPGPEDAMGLLGLIVLLDWGPGVAAGLRVLVRFASPGSWWFQHLYKGKQKTRALRQHAASFHNREIKDGPADRYDDNPPIEWNQRLELAQAKNSQGEILQSLATDRIPAIRFAVVQNPNTPQGVVNSMLETETDRGVIKAARRRQAEAQQN